MFRKIVNISSTSALNGNAGQMNYSSAKAGVIGMTRALAANGGASRSTSTAWPSVSSTRA